MTFTKKDFSSNEVIEVGQDIEFWSNDDIARFGFDVSDGQCVEISLEDMDKFTYVVQNCETGKYSFSGKNGNNRYLFENDHPRVHIYHQQSHVLTFSDDKMSVLFHIQMILQYKQNQN